MEGKKPDEVAGTASPAAAVEPREMGIDKGKAEVRAAEGATSAAPASTLAASIEDSTDVPDPDEDDLDDLDDLLDDFSATKIDAKAAPTVSALPRGPPAASTTTAPAAAAEGNEGTIDDLLNDEEFAKQLQAGMADLLGEIEKSPDVQAQFENLFKEFGITPPADESAEGGAAAAAAATGAAAAAHVAASKPASSATREASAKNHVAPAAGLSSSTSADASFQETIRRTMERMQASGDQATAAAAADSESADDLLSEFMKQMQSGGLGSAGSEEELSKMLVGMMEELTNKEILYEPMKELNDKFPGWMEENRAKTSAEDLKRYEEQQGIVREIVARFEAASYSDANPEDREYIVDRMQKMQAAGSPPPDLVGDMPSAQEALAAPDESCNPQ